MTALQHKKSVLSHNQKQVIEVDFTMKPFAFLNKDTALAIGNYYLPISAQPTITSFRYVVCHFD